MITLTRITRIMPMSVHSLAASAAAPTAPDRLPVLLAAGSRLLDDQSTCGTRMSTSRVPVGVRLVPGQVESDALAAAAASGGCMTDQRLG
jgi:hypothetical protein